MPSRQQRDTHAERIEPGGEAARMLLREQFSGCHEGGLFAVFDGAHGRERGDDGLARAHVALQQPHHRLRAAEIVPDLEPRAFLGAGQAEGQRLQQPAEQLAARRQCPGAVQVRSLAQQSAGSAGAPAAPRTPVDAAPGDGRHSARRDRRRPGGRCTNRKAESSGGSSSAVSTSPPSQSRSAPGAELGQRQRGQVAHATLLNALRDRIDRRQASVRRHSGVDREEPVFRMHDLEAAGAQACFAEAAHPCAAREPLLLRAEK
jgi:hypothetical protein